MTSNVVFLCLSGTPANSANRSKAPAVVINPEPSLGEPPLGKSREEWLAERVELMHLVVSGDLEQVQRARNALYDACPPCVFTLDQAYIGSLLAVHGYPENDHLAALSKIDTAALNATRRVVFAANERLKAEIADSNKPPKNVERFFTMLVAVRERAIEEMARVTSARAQKPGGAA